MYLYFKYKIIRIFYTYNFNFLSVYNNDDNMFKTEYILSLHGLY